MAYDQVYGAEFAAAYDKQFTFFATHFAPRLRMLFDDHVAMQGCPKTLLDVACGTGQLASEFLANGYRVVGIDLSPHMVEIATRNNAKAVESGQATFRVADAASFSIDEPVSYAVSTFD
ncbi:MAG: class I SAM-dependent methyltransferase, partial [Spirochaetales bacterium]